MTEHLDLPDELRALIEKRLGRDRRVNPDAPRPPSNERRSGADRRADGPSPAEERPEQPPQ